MEPFPVVDLALARRLERAEARANVAFVEARARLNPASGATWRDVGGTVAMFDGVGSPITQTFGLGLFSTPTADQLERIEEFFAERGASVQHEVSPLADLSVLSLLPARGYRPIELSTVLYRPVATDDPAPSTTGLPVRLISASEREAWAEMAARAWGSDSPELGDFMLDFGRVSVRVSGFACFVAEDGGAAVATAAMAMHDGVAVLAGASTLPAFRGRGAQSALLRARLHSAAAAGCDLALMGALPGSASQRNAERQGFRIAYTRIKWMRSGAG